MDTDEEKAGLILNPWAETYPLTRIVSFARLLQEKLKRRLSTRILRHFPTSMYTRSMLDTLVIPKKHYTNMLGMPSDQAGRVFAAIAKVMKSLRKV